MIDQIQINFDSDSLWTLNLALALVMYGIALDIEVKQFKELFRTPKLVMAGLLSQFVLLPALTYFFVLWVQPPPSIALGLFLVAACPGGNVSNFMSHLAKANTALSIILTAFATLLSVVMTPLNFQWYASLYEPSASLLRSISVEPGDLFKVVGLLLALPLTLGLYTRYRFKAIAIRLEKILKPLSLLLFIVLVAIALASNWDVFRKYAVQFADLVIVHNTLAILLGFTTAVVFKLDRYSRRSIAIETGIQNSGLGLLLIFTFFDGLGGMAVIAALWGVWHLISGLFLGFFWGVLQDRIRPLVRALVVAVVRALLYLNFKRIEIHGLENIPRGRVIFVGNHQNGLIDPLLIAAFNRRSTTFYTRASVFKNPIVSTILHYLGLLPIFRFRDGGRNLRNNIELFEKGADALIGGEAIVLFPEGNHGAERRIRPLKKGVIRLLETIYRKDASEEVFLVPVGFNYERLEQFKDKVSVRFGPPIRSLDLLSKAGLMDLGILDSIHQSLQNLTTHIEDRYELKIEYLEKSQVNWLEPDEVYRVLKNYPKVNAVNTSPAPSNTYFFSWPVVFFWRKYLMPKIDEVEFITTLRYAYIGVLAFICIILCILELIFIF
ncbi:MAG: 1-acyl-sn-glycerol-3-phosphate acyltransferase [Flavobacteriaceae bacterium]